MANAIKLQIAKIKLIFKFQVGENEGKNMITIDEAYVSSNETSTKEMPLVEVGDILNPQEKESTNYNEEVNFESENSYVPEGSGNSSTEDETDLHQNRKNINKRKRKGNTSTWKRQINKRLRMEGKEYKSIVRDNQGKRVKRAARKLGDVCNCNSIARSCSKINQEVRKEIFDAFWNLSWNDKKTT